MKTSSPFRFLCVLPAAALGLALPSSLEAASLAADNASNYTTETWTVGSNGGFGFGAWDVPSEGVFGEGIVSSSGNGGSPNIDTSGVGFKIQRTGGFNQVTRSFGAGGISGTSALDPGQTFQFSFDFFQFAPSETGQSVGIWLTDSGSGERWGLQFTGGTANLITKVNGGANQDTGIPALNLNNGANVAFTLLTGGAWTATIETLGTGGDTYILDSDSFGTLTGTPTGFRFFVAANGGVKDHYINNLAVVPEPSTVLLLGAAGLAVVLFRRRRASQA